MKSYLINEIYFTLQGEGVRAGTANVFVRFTGCNMRCAVDAGPKSIGGFDCDTEFASGKKMSAKEIIEACDKFYPKGKSKSVVFTGGEPAIQLDVHLVSEMKKDGYFTAIETNGSLDVSELGLDWITVSPKVAEHCVRQLTASEIKYVRRAGQGVPRPTCKATHKILSPAFKGKVIDPEAVECCIDLVSQNPEWRLSIQQHKIWGID